MFSILRSSREFGRGYRADRNEFSLYEHRWYNFAHLYNLIKNSTYLRSMVKVLRWRRVNVRSLRTNVRIDDFPPTNYLLFPSIFFSRIMIILRYCCFVGDWRESRDICRDYATVLDFSRGPLKERKQGSLLMSMTDGLGSNRSTAAWECLAKSFNRGIPVALEIPRNHRVVKE